MKDLNSLVSDLNKREQAIKKLNVSMLPAMGQICVKEIRSNFVKMQGTWKKRSKMTDLLYEYNRTNDYRTPKLGKKSKHKNPYKGSVVHANRPILVQTGNLRDSVTFNVSNNNVSIGVFHRTVKIGNKTHDALQSAKLLNEGGTMRVFNHSGTMPRRKFMPSPAEGPTPTMISSIKVKYDQELNKIFATWK